MQIKPLLMSVSLSTLLFSGAVFAKEYPVGGPVKKEGMEIASSYLLGIETNPMPVSMDMGQDVIHLETDVHATADNKWGFPADAWIPYLTINYVVQKIGDSNFLEFGQLIPMSAADGAHYAHSVHMAGAGTYKVTFKYTAPDEMGYERHVDTATALPQWFKPFNETFTFKYPQS
ncbi:iron transporter [Acinetobacter sp. B5B]|uniref:iron transporter n=1 Tax=Acinetobacter baretiae TaxID=2605383 RepID=UPI0018C2F765|nr:iron transporter [Acinetobacter baretiae]MBF7683188.1 iron transporter [Acinetobacter baretiae]MBF7684447.1 iron transporter [Acinetobacter baretiae]